MAIGGEFVSWNVRFGGEKNMRQCQVCLEESPKFVGKTMCPNVLVYFHFHQVSIFKDIACVVINGGYDEVDGGVRGRGGGLQQDALCCEHISTMKRCLICAK